MKLSKQGRYVEGTSEWKKNPVALSDEDREMVKHLMPLLHKNTLGAVLREALHMAYSAYQYRPDELFDAINAKLLADLKVKLFADIEVALASRRADSVAKKVVAL